MYIFIFLLVLAVVGAIIFYKDWYNSRDHCSYTDIASLRVDAKPLDVKQKEVGTRGRRRWRTTVTFDDGFKYISHKTTVRHNLLSYSISVSRSEYHEILQSAIIKHFDTVMKKS